MDQHLTTDDINFLDQAADIPVSMWPAAAADALSPLPERPVDWAGHTSVAPLSATDGASVLRRHADRLDAMQARIGFPTRPADGPTTLTAEQMRMAAEFLEDQASRPPLPRRQRLKPGLVQELLDAGLVQQARRGRAVDVQFVPAAPPGP